VSDPELAAAIVGLAPQLLGKPSPHHVLRGAAWICGTVAAIAIAGYLTVQAAPRAVVQIVPAAWMDRIGQQLERSLVEGAKRCSSASALRALSAMAGRMTEGDPGLPPLSITIYDMPIVNAFAMPGGRIVLSRGLISAAESPVEIAGVLAHEIGHVVRQHPEAQIVRAVGIQVLIAAITGGGSDTLGTIAGLAAILRYSREAESEADGYAVSLMHRAAIDPEGLKVFFVRLLKEEKQSSGTLGKIGSVLSTHPGTEERIASIDPLPDGVAARPVLSDEEWQALRNACG
jgi:predicted Zn-dependent protease